MRQRSMPFAAILGLACWLVFACAGPLAAHEASVHGLVLGIDAGRARAIVRYERAPGSPAATRAVAVRPRTVLRSLQPGSAFEATLDTDATPWVLSGVRIVGRQALTGATAAAAAGPDLAAMLHDVHHLTAGEFVPATTLVDQSGRPFALTSLRGNAVVLAFVYTRCRDARMCSLISAKFATLQGRLRPERAHLVEVSLDPAYDTPDRLARYGRQFGADLRRWTLATGDPKTVLDFAAQFGVTAFPDPRVGLIHAERTVLIDPNGTIRQLIDETAWSPGEIVAQLHADERLASNPFQRFNLWLSSAAVAVCGNAVASFSGFTDLLIVLAIFVVFAWILFRLARGIYRSA